MHATLLALAVLFVCASATSVKRETGCNSAGMIDPEFCASASEGSFCLTPQEANIPGNNLLVCGCKQDADCFTAPPFPYCVTNAFNGGFCDSCITFRTDAGAPVTSNIDHQFCRLRFPSVYLLNPPVGFTDNSERVPPTPAAYFREVCNRNTGNGGACEGCHQASETNTPEVTFPTYPASVTGASLRGPKGSVFCATVYTGGAGSPSTGEARPICAYNQLFTDAGIATVFQTTTVDLNIARNVNGVDQIETRPIVQWQGACIPCVLGGVERHGLCYLTDATQPICSAAGCDACSSNADCAQQTAPDGKSDGTTTGGPNCQVDGSCIVCLADTDCGNLDLGGNLICDTTSGICIDATPCSENTDCNPGENCMLDGTCRACNPGTDCETNDGGTPSNQPVCNAGICEDCNVNADCAGTSGANCQADGTCLDCGNTLTSANCGVPDGGETPGQTLCNTNSGICETPCNSNNFCVQKGGSDAFTRGANCQADGTCKTCVNDNTCGVLDGGSPSGQSHCDALDTPPGLGQCIDPFSCSVNSDCNDPLNTGLGKNCQTSQQCLNCAVSYTSSTCSGSDGGETPNQINCDQTSRLCVDACNNNNQCQGTQGANCMDNGLCLDCRTDADCATGNAWSGDLNGQDVLCDATSGICFPRCAGNGDCNTGENCMKDGRCTPCTSDANCVSNDGPFPMGTNTVCTAGVCVNPYVCQNNAQDNSGCSQNTGRANCQKDGTCKTCTSAADCGVLDGGQTPNQPTCLADGTCGPCDVNADCPAATPNCGSDGSCYACTLQPNGNECGIFDGGETPNQPNCDPLTNICVDFCTSDDNCLDDCAPHCNLERGCCVECTSDTHCPLNNWRGTEAGRTECSADSTCIFPFTCETDSDCPSGTPACSLAEEECVECLFDHHCGEPTPACSTSEQICVECLYDSHCAAGDVCGSDQTCNNDNNPIDFNGASVFSFLSAGLLVALASVLRF